MKTTLVILAAAAGAMAGPAALAPRAMQNATVTPYVGTPVPLLPSVAAHPNTTNVTLTRVPTIETPVPVVPGMASQPTSRNVTLTKVPTIETPIPVGTKKRASAASVEASLGAIGGVEGLDHIASKTTIIVKVILDRLITNCTTVACIGSRVDSLLSQLKVLDSTLTPLGKINLSADVGAKAGDIGVGVQVGAGVDLSGLTSGVTGVVGSVLGVAQSVVSLLSGLGGVTDIATGLSADSSSQLASLVASITAKVGNVAGVNALLSAVL